ACDRASLPGALQPGSRGRLHPVARAGRRGSAFLARRLRLGMATAVTMPRLGLTMVEGTVVEWKARPGDSVEKGQIILVIESEKVEVEVEAFSGGTLAAIYVEPGATVPIGSLLGAVTDPDESFDRDAFERAFV